MLFGLIVVASQGGLLDTAHAVGEAFGFNLWAFVSQALSFSLVCGLLYKFAYKPILEVLEERKNKINEALRDAVSVKVQLAEAQKKANEIVAEASAGAQRLIDDAKSAAKEFQERRLREVASEAEAIVLRARDEAKRDYEKMILELRAEVARLVVHTTSKVIGRVLTVEDQHRLTEAAASDLAA
jgi:F-type H+-transporting ATPase subunit b